MKLLLVLPAWSGASAASCVGGLHSRALATSLAGRAHQVVVLVPGTGRAELAWVDLQHQEDCAPGSLRVRQLECRALQLPQPRWGRDALALEAASRWIEGERFDAAWVRLQPGLPRGLLRAAFRSGATSVFELADLKALELGPLAQADLENELELARACCVPSHAARRAVAKASARPESAFEVEGWGWPTPPQRTAQSLRRLPLSIGCWTSPAKGGGWLLALEALRLSRYRTLLELHLFGEPLAPRAEQLLAALHQLPVRRHALCERNAVRLHLALCPAREDAAFALEVVEARALGLPALVADTPSQVEVAGASSLCFSSGDAYSLAAALECCVEQPTLVSSLCCAVRPPRSIEQQGAAVEARLTQLREELPRPRLDRWVDDLSSPPPLESACALPREPLRAERAQLDREGVH